MSETRKPWEYSIPVVSKTPRPIGITSATDGDWTYLYVLFDDGSIWKKDPMGPWTRLPPIPQGDA